MPRTEPVPSPRTPVSSADSESAALRPGGELAAKEGSYVKYVCRSMFLCSAIFLVTGILLTVFGFSDSGVINKLGFQVMGTSCLTLTIVLWVLGVLLSRLWNAEWRRREKVSHLHDQAQLRALALDFLSSSAMNSTFACDSLESRHLLMQLRSQKAMDFCSELSETERRWSRASSVQSTIRRSSALLERKRSVESHMSTKPTIELPGIHISRIETLDFGDGRASIASGCSRSSRGSRQYIIVQRDELGRLSCPSDYSLNGSRSSRSRSSRASSNLSSRLWDFSPRESEWDADISLGSRESQLSGVRQDWGGGPADLKSCSQEQLSPLAPRRLSVVSFEQETTRRHSSPACAHRRKDSQQSDCRCAHDGRARDSCHSLRFSDGIRIVETTRKRSSDLLSIISPNKIDEEERESSTEETTMTVTRSESPEKKMVVRNDSLRKMKPFPDENIPSTHKPLDSEQEKQHEGNHCVMGEDTGTAAIRRRPLEQTSLATLKRNNTDDSEVERRVERLLRQIEFSISDGVEEPKLRPRCNDPDYAQNQMKSTTHKKRKIADGNEPGRGNSSRKSQCEVQTQTSIESLIKKKADGAGGEEKRPKNVAQLKRTLTALFHQLRPRGKNPKDGDV